MKQCGFHEEAKDYKKWTCRCDLEIKDTDSKEVIQLKTKFNNLNKKMKKLDDEERELNQS